ncbi:MAG: hypothetical protein E7E23_24635, partial [Paenibacillus sp.]|uniref:hypothetical protein n=1 Tax=Paenibacillus sp. TaxID=58172 RepID=UPI0028FF69F1
ALGLYAEDALLGYATLLWEPAWPGYVLLDYLGVGLEGEIIPSTLLDCGLDRVCEPLDLRLFFHPRRHHLECSG